MAEQAIENVQKLVDKEAQCMWMLPTSYPLPAQDTFITVIGKKKNANEAKETKDRVRKILTGTYQVIAVVEGASEVNPFAKVSYYKGCLHPCLTKSAGRSRAVQGDCALFIDRVSNTQSRQHLRVVLAEVGDRSQRQL